MMIKPIKPDEIKKTIPDEIIEVFNELIREYWDGKQSCFTLDEAAHLCGIRMRKSVDFLFEKRYFDIEDTYREAGWVVEFDKPGYNESYPATFTFLPKQGFEDELPFMPN